MKYQTAAALGCLLLWATGGYSAPIYTNHLLHNTDPVIYWRLDELLGTTARDAAPGGPYNGTYTNMYTLGAAGPRPADGLATMNPGNVAPNAHSGNGTARYTQLSTTAGVPTGSYSYQMWFNSSVAQWNNRTLQYLFTRGNDTTDPDRRDGIYIGGSWSNPGAPTGKLGFTPEKDTYIGGTRLLEPDRWYHLVFVRDDYEDPQNPDNMIGDARVYLNGKLEIQSTRAWHGGTGNHLTAGQRTDLHSTLGLYGRFDEVAVWNRPLGEAEVKNLYLGALGSPYMASVLRKEPTSYWRLDETTGVNVARDSTDNGRAFNYTVSAGISRTGEGSDLGPRPATFGGLPADNNAPTLAATRLGIVNNLLLGQNDYSAEMWFRPGDSIHPYGHYLLHRGTNLNDGDYFGVRSSDSSVPEAQRDRLYFYDGSLFVGSTQLVKDQWYHVGMSRNGDAVKVYLNGLEEISISRVAKTGLTTGQWAFGGRGDTVSNMHFTGNIDEIAVYGTAMGGSNFQENYLSAIVNRGVPYAKTVLRYSPESYWRLDEVSPYTLAIDATGHGHTFSYHFNASRTGSGTDVGPRGDQFPGLGPDNNAPTLNATRLGVADGILAGQVDYTAQMWFRPGDSVHWYGHYLLHRGEDGEKGDYLGVRASSLSIPEAQRDRLYFFDGTLNVGNTVLTKDQWYHVAMTRAGNNVTIYLNGQEELSVNRAPKAGLTNGDWAFGGRSELATMNFTGNIDEIALYGRALSKFHVQASYLSAFPRDECDYSHAVLASGPDAYWRLNEGPEWIAAMDSSGNAHHFQYQPSVQRGNPGPRPAAHFLGFENGNPAPRLTGGPTGSLTNGYLGIATGVLPGQNDYTAEMWFRRDAVGIIGAYLMHRNDLDASGGQVRGDLLGLWPVGGEIRLLAYDGAYPYITWLEGSTNILQDEWYHLAMVRQEDAVFVYLNGQLEIEGTMAPAAGTKWVDGTWAFGGRTDRLDLNQRFAGSLDEIAIYGRALSQEEIRAHYLVGVPEPSTWLLLSLGALSLAAKRRRKRRSICPQPGPMVRPGRR